MNLQVNDILQAKKVDFCQGEHLIKTLTKNVVFNFWNDK